MPWGDLCDLRTTWFVISPYLAAVNQAQSTRTQLFGPGSLGLCAKEKSTLTERILHTYTLNLEFLSYIKKLVINNLYQKLQMWSRIVNFILYMILIDFSGSISIENVNIVFPLSHFYALLVIACKLFVWLSL